MPDFFVRRWERNDLLANLGRAGSSMFSGGGGPFCGHRNVGRGLVCGDYDNDERHRPVGDDHRGRARLYRNVAPNRGQWLKGVRHRSQAGPRRRTGLEVTVVAGGRRFFRVLSPAESYLSSGPPILHFGLGIADRVSRIEVKWPDGLSEEFGDCRGNSTLHLQRGTRPAQRRQMNAQPGWGWRLETGGINESGAWFATPTRRLLTPVSRLLTPDSGLITGTVWQVGTHTGTYRFTQ